MRFNILTVAGLAASAASAPHQPRAVKPHLGTEPLSVHSEWPNHWHGEEQLIPHHPHHGEEPISHHGLEPNNHHEEPINHHEEPIDHHKEPIDSSIGHDGPDFHTNANKCYHGRTAPTLDKKHPWAGGAINCTYWPNPATKEYKLIPGDEGAAIQLVSIAAEFESMNPLKIKMTIKNITPLPITFWKEWSPLSKRGWELGHFSIETNIWGHFFGRVGEKYPMAMIGEADIPKRPSSASELVQLNPGDSISSIVTIPTCQPEENSETCKPYMWDRWTEMLRLAGIKKILVQGDWHGIWAKTKEEVMDNMEDHPMAGYWTRWWADTPLFPTTEQLKEFGTYLPFNEPWYETEAASDEGHH
ncbi:hypothetical protein FLONG3_1961 [Fusarium longipes]|uniref:Uncharacterized protein n=1 Tax=Fusarium longipes TaxID=694270 RepID=A0A395T5D7_9HYPO|nr:hypothetical protein FLONG3_1961 [Fusarium longipes]